MNRIELAGGTYLAERLDGLFTWHPEERVVAATIADGVATLATTDDPPEAVGTFNVVENGPRKPARRPGGSRPAAGAAAGGKARGADATRWETLNEFVDAILPAMHPTDAVVWIVLYRRAAADGKVFATNRGLAQKANVGLRSVARSLSRLKEAGLVTEERMSMHKSDGASEYRLNVRPKTCAAERRRPRKTRPR